MPPNVRKASKAQEDRIAKLFGGKRTPASGAKWYCKGDVKCANFLIEAKFTDSGKFKFSMQVWNKIEREAIETGKIPLICVGLRGEGIGVKRNYVIFDCSHFDEFSAESYETQYTVEKVVNMDVDFIIQNTPFVMTSAKATFIMMRERDFLDELNLV